MARRRSDDDFAREVEAHIRIEADRLAAEGLTPEEAEARARRAFGNVTGARERFYEARRIRWVDEVRTDVRSAWRNLRRAPVAALVIVLSLAGGIGAATAALVVRNVIFYNPPPLYSEPGRLSRVQAAPVDRLILPGGSDVPAGLFAYWRQALGAEIAAAGQVARRMSARRIASTPSACAPSRRICLPYSACSPSLAACSITHRRNRRRRKPS